MKLKITYLITALLFLGSICNSVTSVANEQQCQQAHEQKKQESVIEFCQPLAEQGDSEAAFRLGEAYDFLDTLTNHSEQARHWYTIAAKQGHPLAQRNLAALYDGGYGVERDPFKAFFWYRQAALQGQPHSQLMTGMMSLYGTGTAQDNEQATYWFQQAAQSGEPNGQYMYGKIIYDQNPQQALGWFNKSAQQNNRYALYQLGLLHYRGEHLLASDDAALAMAKKSLLAGHEKAQQLIEKLQQRQHKSQQEVASLPQQAKSSLPRPQAAKINSQAKALPVAVDDSEWFLQQPKQNYSIQLALMSQYASIQRFQRYYPSVKPTFYYQSHFNNGNRFVLLLGSYSTLQEAKQALEALPDEVQKMRPWIRQFDTLQEQYSKPQ